MPHDTGRIVPGSIEFGEGSRRAFLRWGGVVLGQGKLEQEIIRLRRRAGAEGAVHALS